MSRTTRAGRQFVYVHVPNIASLPPRQKRYLPSITIDEFEWQFCVFRLEGDYIAMSIRLNNQRSGAFDLDLMYTIRVLSSNCKNSIVRFSDGTKRVKPGVELAKVITKWSDLLKPENGYVASDGSMLSEAELAYEAKAISAFDDPTVCDTSLVVGDRKFYADKYLLAGHSEFFRVLFFGDFADSRQKQLELFDVNPDNFLFFLRVLHYDEYLPPESSIGGILELGDRFRTDVIIARCQKLLIRNDPDTKILLRLHYAEKYKMPILQLKCLIEGQSNDCKLIDGQKDDDELKCFDERTSSSVWRLLSDTALWAKSRDPADPTKMRREAVQVPKSCSIM